jgi:hypothetical protein
MLLLAGLRLLECLEQGLHLAHLGFLELSTHAELPGGGKIRHFKGPQLGRHRVVGGKH